MLDSLEKLVWPLAATSAAISLLLTLLSTRELRNGVRLFSSILSLSLLGMVTGYLTGLSRESAVGDVLPAVLALLGAGFLYLIGKEGENLRAIVSICIIAMVSSLMLGVDYGSQKRGALEIARIAKPYRLQILAIDHAINVQRLLYEKHIRDLRQKLGLPQVTSTTKPKP